MRLRVDPWEPEYGASVELLEELEPAAGLDLTVEEAGQWRPIPTPTHETVPCCAFVDGVRRVDASLLAEEGDIQAPGLAGTWAVGCAWSTKPPSIGHVEVGRSVVVGAGLTPDPLITRAGSQTLRFEPVSIAGKGPLDPLRGLQNAMRDAEARVANAALNSGRAELVVADGPLGYSMPGHVVGMIKRQSRGYLDGSRGRVLAQLRAGERSPIFKLGDQRLQRYSWYLRLADRRPIDGAMAGLVRLEVDATRGLAAAQELSELAGSVLPMFASRPGRDPRAPQNLYPVGALEGHLRHRLGDALLVRRAIEARLFEEIQIG